MQRLVSVLLVAVGITGFQISGPGSRNRPRPETWTVLNASRKPKLIVFDLDGCLWRPEMYELAWDGRQHAPFEPCSEDGTKMKSQMNTIVKLIGDVAELLDDFYMNKDTTWEGTELAISSRTDVPEWAKELLEKMRLPEAGVSLNEVITGPHEIAHDSKTSHFQRLSKQTGIALEDMVFFDNEFGNCRSVAQLGVTVAYTPKGVKKHSWESAMALFPKKDGQVLE